MKKIIMLLLVAVAALGVALFIQVRSHSSSSTPTTLDPSSTSIPNGSSSSTTSKSTPVCTTSSLAISLAQGSAGAGHVSAPLVFKNTSTATCAMSGYPGVDGGNANHTLSESALNANGSGLSTVTLQPGQSASATLVAVNVPSGAQTSCGNFSVFYVTPPNTKAYVKIPTTMPSCPGLTVYPVVSGTAGT